MYRLLGILFVAAVGAEVHLQGACKFDIPLVTILNVTALQGTWHQISRTPNSVEKGECAKITLTPVYYSSILLYVGIHNTEVVSGKLVERNGTIEYSSTIGVLNITYNDGSSQNYAILGTDYSDYLVLYGCANSGNNSTVNAWQLGRNVTYSATTANKTMEIVEANPNLVNATWKTVSHSESACKINNSAVNIQISPLILFLAVAGLALTKES